MSAAAVIIDLCTSSDEEENEPVQSLGTSAGKRKAPPTTEKHQDAKWPNTTVVSDSESESESDVEEVAPPQRPPTVAPAVGSSSSAPPPAGTMLPDEDEDEDVAFVGRTGHLALCDFPHARENCAAVPFATGREHQHCENCYCYCCDKPASACKEWVSHCKATHSDQKWRKPRSGERLNTQTPRPFPADTEARQGVRA